MAHTANPNLGARPMLDTAYREMPLDPYAVKLEHIDVTQPHLWVQNAHWGYFKRLREEAPVHYCADSPWGPYWSVCKFEDVFYVDTHHDLFSSQGGITLAEGAEDFQIPMFIAMDPPKHDAQRRAVQPIVGSAMLDKLQPMIRERAGKILDDLPRGEAFDFVDRVSIELTTQMLATLFDFPWEDRRKLTRWSDVSTGSQNPEICPGGEEQWRAELTECATYFTHIWNQRVNAPPSYDLISLMAHDPATRDMTPQEFLGNLILLIVGGNDTTRNSMTGGVWAMHQNPQEKEKLDANPALLDSMVPEIIRWQTPLAFMRRRATADTEIRGQKIKAGDKIAMWYVSGNRDADATDNPDAFIIDRARPRHHLSFGYGIHRCVGMRVAEMQLRTVWEEMLKRFARIEVVAPPQRIPSAFVHGYKSMMVKLH
jgi:cytochrome P450